MSASAQNALFELARRGVLKGATVINNFGITNALVQAGVPTVVHRADVSSGGGGPTIHGDEGDIAIGRAWWHESSNQNAHNSLDSRVYIQCFNLNEQNAGNDGWFYLGLMQEADKQGRKLGIFADSVGNPDLIQRPDGSWSSPVWESRAASGCLAYGKTNNHIAVLHEYGRLINMKGTDDPGSAIFLDGHRDDTAWLWFGGGRHTKAYSLIPENCRMNIHIGECGCSNINKHGADFVHDFIGYQTRYGNDPYVVSYAYWQLGGRGTIDWGVSCLDDDMPVLLGAI